MLSIRGQKHSERSKEDGDSAYHLVERSYGAFTRSFRLPKGVDESKISASFEHGVLAVRIPKAALPQPKKIAIDVGSASNGKQVKADDQTANAA